MESSGKFYHFMILHDSPKFLIFGFGVIYLLYTYMYKLQQQPFISFCLMFNMYVYITITIIISIIVLNCMGKLYTFPLISFSNISIKNLTDAKQSQSPSQRFY